MDKPSMRVGRYGTQWPTNGLRSQSRFDSLKYLESVGFGSYKIDDSANMFLLCASDFDGKYSLIRRASNENHLVLDQISRVVVSA
jgi:hypothetical protein